MHSKWRQLRWAEWNDDESSPLLSVERMQSGFYRRVSWESYHEIDLGKNGSWTGKRCEFRLFYQSWHRLAFVCIAFILWLKSKSALRATPPSELNRETVLLLVCVVAICCSVILFTNATLNHLGILQFLTGNTILNNSGSALSENWHTFIHREMAQYTVQSSSLLKAAWQPGFWRSFPTTDETFNQFLIISWCVMDIMFAFALVPLL